jgi:hypothetical protein
MLKLVIEGATKYSFNDRESGRLVEGINLYYLEPKNTANSVGKIPQKITISDVSKWEKVNTLVFPSTVELVTEQILGSKGIINKVVNFVVASVLVL